VLTFARVIASKDTLAILLVDETSLTNIFFPGFLSLYKGAVSPALSSPVFAAAGPAFFRPFAYNTT